MKIEIKGTICNDEDKWIYDYFGITATCPGDVNKKITEANGSQIDIYVNSGGGEIFAGSEIYSLIQSYTGDKKIHVVGLAASAASVIACAAESDITATAMLMIHNVSGYANGDYNIMDKTSETLKKANKAIAGAYIQKTGKTEEELLNLMNKETWLTAQEAVEQGFVDKIAQSNQKPEAVTLVAAYNCNYLSPDIIAKTKEKIRAKTQIELLKLKNKER